MKSGVLKAAERVKSEVQKEERKAAESQGSRATTAPAIFPAIKKSPPTSKKNKTGTAYVDL